MVKRTDLICLLTPAIWEQNLKLGDRQVNWLKKQTKKKSVLQMSLTESIFCKILFTMSRKNSEISQEIKNTY